MNSIKSEGEAQIQKKRKEVKYDTSEFTLEWLVQLYTGGIEEDKNRLYIPSYQRDFVWDAIRQSRFIESLILGLPIPYLFAADIDGRLEVIDGSQRLRTVVSFLQNKLTLTGLDVLTSLNSCKYSDRETSRQNRVANTSLRMIVLDEASDEDARFMLFDRINSGSMLINAMEKRRGTSGGVFTGFLEECSNNPLFIKLTKFTELAKKRHEPEELILRFFAYSEMYKDYQGPLNEFLSNYTDLYNKKAKLDPKVLEDKKRDFQRMLEYVQQNFKLGFLRSESHNNTPRGRFEAISVGTHLALREKPNLPNQEVGGWLDSDRFIEYTTGGSTNAKYKIEGRIEFVRNKLISK